MKTRSIDFASTAGRRTVAAVMAAGSVLLAGCGGAATTDDAKPVTRPAPKTPAASTPSDEECASQVTKKIGEAMRANHVTAENLANQTRSGPYRDSLEQAGKSLSSCLEESPDNFKLLSLMGSTQMTLGEFQKAIPTLERAVDAAPATEKADSLYSLGIARGATCDYPGTVDAFQEAMRLGGGTHSEEPVTPGGVSMRDQLNAYEARLKADGAAKVRRDCKAAKRAS